MRVVIDTNVLYSSLRSGSGASFEILSLVRSGTLKPAITAPLVFEYEDALHRQGGLPHLTRDEIAAFLDWFVSRSTHHSVYFLWRPLLTDPKDDMVLEAAVASQADHLVTFNSKDFLDASLVGISAVTPQQLLALLRKVKNR